MTPDAALDAAAKQIYADHNDPGLRARLSQDWDDDQVSVYVKAYCLREARIRNEPGVRPATTHVIFADGVMTDLEGALVPLWTNHGYWVLAKGTEPLEPERQPAVRAKCGGPGVCRQCEYDRDAMRASMTHELWMRATQAYCDRRKHGKGDPDVTWTGTERGPWICSRCAGQVPEQLLTEALEGLIEGG